MHTYETGSKREQSPRYAEEMAHAQESYQRTRAVGELLKVQFQESSEKGVEEVMASARRGDTNNTLIALGRKEIQGAVRGNIANNLAEKGHTVDYLGRIKAEAGVDSKSTDAASRILNEVPKLVTMTTQSELDSRDISRAVSIADSDRPVEGRNDTEVTRLVLEGVGIDPDTLEEYPYTPGGMTDTGLVQSVRRVPTGAPGVYYESSRYTNPGDPDAAPIEQSRLTIAAEGDTRPALIAA